MERIFAFIDESGAFGWDLDNPSVSKYFILTAVIIDESNLKSVFDDAEKIRRTFFQQGEMKSSKIGSNHSRRQKLLAEISKLNCKFFSIVFDKNKLKNENYKGLQFKQPFYKFLNNILDTELTKAFPKITIVSDSTGDNDFIKSFINYMKTRVGIPDLFGESDIQLRDSKEDVLIQVADIVSGTLQCVYDKSKNVPNEYDFLSQIKNQFIRIEIYPQTFENYDIEKCPLASEYDIEISRICYEQARAFVIKNEKSKDLDVVAQVMTLRYLLFRFMNNNLRDYISTKELKNNLIYTGIESMTDYYFRTKVIGKLRDSDVIIASSQQGYKLPTKKRDLIDFMNHDKTILLPMLSRLKKCRNLIQLGTSDKIDLFAEEGFETMKKLFDALYKDIPDKI